MAKGYDCVFSKQGLYFRQRLNHIHDSLLAINSQSLSETTNDVRIHILRKPLSANSQCFFEQKTDERYLLFTNIIRYNLLVHRPDELELRK